MDYRILHNIDALAQRPYSHGDRLADGWTDSLAALGVTGEPMDADDARDIAEAVFIRHQRDNRPDGHTAPSLSCGDVVLIGEVAFAANRRGWDTVDVDPAQLVGKPYLDCVLW